MWLERKEALQKVNVPTRGNLRLNTKGRMESMRPEFRENFVRLSITLHAWHSVWAPES